MRTKSRENTMNVMINYLQMSLLLLVTIPVTQAASSGTYLFTVQEGRSITGEIGAEFMVRSDHGCSLRCIDDVSCKAFRHQGNGTDDGSCFLIHSVCAAGAGQIFEQDDNSELYQKDGTWTSPSKWTGPDAALYRNFDDSNGLTLMEGSLQMTSIPLVSGQVNCAWNLQRSKSQWIDLGIETDVCMARPETCGAAGGALSLWINAPVYCSGFCGIISSYADRRTGSKIFLSNTQTRFDVYLRDGYYLIGTSKISGWIHVVLNYIGPNNGTRLFQNGQEVKSDASIDAASLSSGDARIVVGRRYTNVDNHHGNVQVDELIFFNQALSDEEIELIYN